MRYHGNYCGPNWSAGKYQSSVIDPSVPAIDDFDQTCLNHDAVYATNGDVQTADLDFFRENILKGPKRALAAVSLVPQMAARLMGAHINMPKHLRQPTISVPNKGAKTPNTKLTTVPAAYGFSLRMSKPRVTRSGNKASIIGSDFAGLVNTVNTSDYHPAASVLLNPAYFQNAMLGSLSRAFEKYRFTKAVLQYIPAVPTSLQGQLVMTSTRTVKEPFLDGSSTTFLSRALSQGNAVACPLLKEEAIEIECDKEWYIVDSLIDADLDDSIQEEIQLYTTCTSTATCGIVILHYEIEFKDPLYTFHSTQIPVPIGNGSFVNFTDAASVNTTTTSIALTNASLSFSGSGNGALFRMIFRPEASTLPTGPATWAAVAKLQVTSGATTTTDTSNFTNITLAPGSVVYGILNGTNINLYGSYDDAVGGVGQGQLIYQTATTAVGAWYFIIAQVRLSPVQRMTVQ
jgi:hypothetical protein